MIAQTSINRGGPSTSAECTPSAVPPGAIERTGTLRFKVKDISKMIETVRSPGCWINGAAWRMMIMPRTCTNNSRKEKNLGFFVQCFVQSYSDDWKCSAMAEMRILPNNQNAKIFSRKTNHTYSAKESDWGYSSFYPWADILSNNGGYSENDSCVFEIFVRAHTPTNVYTYQSLYKRVHDYLNLAHYQRKLGHIDKALDAVVLAQKVCQAKDKKLESEVEKLNGCLIEEKLKQSINRLENTDDTQKEEHKGHLAMKQALSANGVKRVVNRGKNHSIGLPNRTKVTTSADNRLRNNNSNITNPSPVAVPSKPSDFNPKKVNGKVVTSGGKNICTQSVNHSGITSGNNKTIADKKPYNQVNQSQLRSALPPRPTPIVKKEPTLTSGGTSNPNKTTPGNQPLITPKKGYNKKESTFETNTATKVAFEHWVICESPPKTLYASDTNHYPQTFSPTIEFETIIIEKPSGCLKSSFADKEANIEDIFVVEEDEPKMDGPSAEFAEGNIDFGFPDNYKSSNEFIEAPCSSQAAPESFTFPAETNEWLRVTYTQADIASQLMDSSDFFNIHAFPKLLNRPISLLYDPDLVSEQELNVLGARERKIERTQKRVQSHDMNMLGGFSLFELWENQFPEKKIESEAVMMTLKSLVSQIDLKSHESKLRDSEVIRAETSDQVAKLIDELTNCQPENVSAPSFFEMVQSLNSKRADFEKDNAEIDFSKLKYYNFKAQEFKLMVPRDIINVVRDLIKRWKDYNLMVDTKLKTFENEKIKMESELQIKARDLTVLKVENARILEVNSILTDQCKTAEEDNKKLVERNRINDDAIENFRTNNASLKQLTKEHAAYKKNTDEEIAKFKRENQSLMDSKRNLQQDISILQDANKNLEKRNDEKGSSTKKIETQFNTLKKSSEKEINTLTEKVKKMEAVLLEKNFELIEQSYDFSLEKANNEINHLNEKIESLQPHAKEIVKSNVRRLEAYIVSAKKAIGDYKKDYLAHKEDPSVGVSKKRISKPHPLPKLEPIPAPLPPPVVVAAPIVSKKRSPAPKETTNIVSSFRAFEKPALKNHISNRPFQETPPINHIYADPPPQIHPLTPIGVKPPAYISQTPTRSFLNTAQKTSTPVSLPALTTDLTFRQTQSDVSGNSTWNSMGGFCSWGVGDNLVASTANGAAYQDKPKVTTEKVAVVESKAPVDKVQNKDQLFAPLCSDDFLLVLLNQTLDEKIEGLENLTKRKEDETNVANDYVSITKPPPSNDDVMNIFGEQTLSSYTNSGSSYGFDPLPEVQNTFGGVDDNKWSNSSRSSVSNGNKNGNYSRNGMSQQQQQPLQQQPLQQLPLQQQYPQQQYQQPQQPQQPNKVQPPAAYNSYHLYSQPPPHQTPLTRMYKFTESLAFRNFPK
uniref:MATH domain-containing protein n=1 Tax=Rhabditophanes sp. KR3021 TaxID=114890 RepID=A0AC35TG13_9BILA